MSADDFVSELADAEMRAFRQQVREFCRSHLPADIRQKVDLGLKVTKDDHARWQKALHSRGWMGGHWPVEHGGRGWKPLQRWIFEQTLAEEGAPWLIPMGVAYVGPVIYTFGNAEQQQRFLPGIQSGSEFWAQGYSEPGAGSDLAGLKMRADRDGDDLVLNGQKTWTTYAQWADWMFCLVRTAQGGRPQDGVSFVLVDMKSPGVTVRPIRTMDGKHHINEVFFDDVRVPTSNLVGKENHAWHYAKFLLVQERLIAAETGRSRHLLGRLRAAADRVCEGGRPLAQIPSFASALAEAEINLRTLEAVCFRLLGRADEDNPGGVEVNLLKIRGSEIEQQMTTLMMRVTGRAGIPFEPAALCNHGNEPPVLVEGENGMAYEHLYLRAATIYGGSNEIQRGIIAKQGLDL